MLQKPSTGAGCLARALPSAVQPVWITDSVLSDAFQRFCRIRRRHGSSVPGPLEAQRRASKRRSTNLASSENGSTAPSTAVLFGKPPQHSWWQTQPEPEAKPPKPILPKWLLHSTEPPPYTEPLPAVDESLMQPEPYASSAAELRACRSVDDIHSVIFRRAIDLHRNPIGINVLMSFLGSNSTWTLDEVLKFLTDPRLNPPGTRSYSRLMSVLVHAPTQLSGRFRTLESWQSIHHALCKAVGLGLVGSEEFAKIVLALPAIKCGHGSDGFKLLSNITVHEQTLQLFQSLNASAILNIGDLSVNFRQTLLRRTATANPSPTTIGLRRLLHQFPLDEESFSEANFIVSWLSNTTHRTSSIFDNAIADYLLALPRSSLLPLLPQVTEHLFSMAKKDAHDAPAFAVWSAVLGSLKTGRTQDCSFSNDDFQVCRQGFSNQLTSVEVTLLSHWLAHAIHRGEDDRLVDDFDYKDNIRNSFAPDPVQPLDWLEDAINGLKYLPVSNHKALLFKIARSLRAGLQGRAGPAPMPGPDPDPFYRQALSRLSDDLFYGCAKIVFKGELVAMCNSLTANLDTFAQAVGKITENEETDYRFFKRALSQSSLFFLGLQQCRKNREQWREVLLVDHVALVYSKPLDPALANIFRKLPSDVGRLLPPPQSFLDVIDRVAIYIAMNERIPPQQAYNRVRNWWRYIRQNRSPVSPLITRALWHAGVTRQGHDGCSTTQLRWIFEQVRYVEGKEVAQTLMRDPAFRVHRRMMLQDLLAEIESVIGRENENLHADEPMSVDIWGNKLQIPAQEPADNAELQGDFPVSRHQRTLARAPRLTKIKVKSPEAPADEVEDPEVTGLGTAEAQSESSTEELVAWNGQFSENGVIRSPSP